MALTEAEYDSFLSLIAPTAAKTEVECAKYLEHATMRLFPNFPELEVTVELERRSHFGRSDFFVLGEYRSDVGKKERRIYFWELKAAQCFPFQRDDSATRIRPTVELIKAETQLLHYVKEAREDNGFLATYGLSAHNVKIGGIIIGRDDRLWDPETEKLSHRDAAMSFEIRKNLVYDKIDLRLMTWDRISDVLKPSQDFDAAPED